MQAELIEQRDALMKLRRPSLTITGFFHDLVLSVGMSVVGENAWTCRSSMSGRDGFYRASNSLRR
jgi:hypothetical protein